MTWVRERNRLCEYCRHEDEVHDLHPDQRVPKEVEQGSFACSDCADCAIREVRSG